MVTRAKGGYRFPVHGWSTFDWKAILFYNAPQHTAHFRHVRNVLYKENWHWHLWVANLDYICSLKIN